MGRGKQDEREPPLRIAGGGRPSRQARAKAAGEILHTAAVLRQLASANELRLIAYLLDMVTLEATDTQAKLGGRDRKP